MFNYKKSRKDAGAYGCSKFIMQSSVFAETLELDLDDAVQRALTTIRQIKIAVSEKKGSRAELNAARAGRGISISAEHRSGRGGYAEAQRNSFYRCI